MSSPSALFSALIAMPVPFCSASDHLGEVAGGGRENRETRRAGSQDERGRERERGRDGQKGNVNNGGGQRSQRKNTLHREMVLPFVLVLQFAFGRHTEMQTCSEVTVSVNTQIKKKNSYCKHKPSSGSRVVNKIVYMRLPVSKCDDTALKQMRMLHFSSCLVSE